MSNLRIGQGFDAHALVLNRPLWLCGIEITFEKGLLGHSDGDVAIHALCDALLGAVAAGDMGTYFPSQDARFFGVHSLYLLEQTQKIVADRGFFLINVDITILAQKPELSPYSLKMREKIARTLNLEIESVSVKSKTTDHLGFVGREEGIAAFAIVLLEKP